MRRRRKHILLSAVLVGTLIMLQQLNLATLAAPAGVMINEIRIDQTGADNDEYFELAGPAGAVLDGLTYLVIGDGSSSDGSGVIEVVVDLDGQSIPAGGFLVVAESSFSLGTADVTTSLNFENGDNVTHVLVSDFNGANGDDLDANDDGVLDVSPWTEVIDLIAMVEEENPPGGTEFHYGPPVAGPLGTTVPGHVFRCAGGWEIGQLNPAGGDDTPGAANNCPTAPLVINEIDYDQAGPDTAEFIEIKNPGQSPVSLAGYTLALIDGSDATAYRTIDLPGTDLAIGAYFVICTNLDQVPNCDLALADDGDLIQNGAPEAVALLLNGTIIDTISYEGDTAVPYTETSGVGLEDDETGAGAGISRFPDGLDTNRNNIDLSLRCTTPGQVNTAASTDCIRQVDLQLTKDDGQTSVRPGEILTYLLTIRNQGPQDASGVVVRDTLPGPGVTLIEASDGAIEAGGVITWPGFNLAAGTDRTLTVTIQVDDLFPAGVDSITNIAQVSADGTGGEDPTPENNTASDTNSVEIIFNPELILTKTTDQPQVISGSDVEFILTVANTGDVPLENVVVSDAQCDTEPAYTGGDTDGDSVLQTTETWIYACTVADVTADFTNAARVTAVDPNGDPVPEAEDRADVDVINPGLALTKTPDQQTVVRGSDVEFALIVSNLGDVPLENVMVSDAQCAAKPVFINGDDNQDNKLQPDESWTYTCTVENVLTGFTNTSQVTADDPNGDPVPSVEDNADVDVINPVIVLAKTPTQQTVASGSDVEFTLTVSNTGDVELTNVVVSDAQCDTGPTYLGGDTNSDGSLQTSESWTYVCTVENVLTDFSNNAGVTGSPPLGGDVSDQAQAEVTVTELPADIEPPRCELVSIRPTAPVQIDLAVQDSGSGLDQINLISAANANIEISTFEPATTTPVIVSAQINDPEDVLVALEVLDARGNINATCRLEGLVVNESLGNRYSTGFDNRTLTFSINSTWTHTAGSNIITPLGIKAVSLSGPGCPCTVRDHVGQSGAAGSMFSSPPVAQLADGRLTFGEQFNHVFDVHLNRRAGFSFFVDVWGIKFTNGTGLTGLAVPAGTGTQSFRFDISDDQLQVGDEEPIYLPIVVK